MATFRLPHRVYLVVLLALQLFCRSIALSSPSPDQTLSRHKSDSDGVHKPLRFPAKRFKNRYSALQGSPVDDVGQVQDSGNASKQWRKLKKSGSDREKYSNMSTEQRIARLRSEFERNRQNIEDVDVHDHVAAGPPPRRSYWLPNAEYPAPMPDLDEMVRSAGVTTEKPFLFIGVLSSRRTYRRRVTVRNTWLQYVTHKPTQMVDVKFVLSTDEVIETDGEKEENILYVNAAVTYSTILIKVFVMMEHALNTGARWLLKTDDDAYVNVPQTVQNLLTLCKTAACDHEKSYVGTFIGGSPVMMDAKHKWHNQAYILHATVKNYLPYALGGGYILSGDILKVLVAMHRSVSLTFTPIEDATVGMWVAGLNVTRINWEGAMLTAGWTCCFTRSQQRDARNEVLGRYTMSADPCKPVRVGRPIHMHEAIQKLLERSAQDQADEVGHSLSLSVHENDENAAINDDEADEDLAFAGDGRGRAADARGSAKTTKASAKRRPGVLAATHVIPGGGSLRDLRAVQSGYNGGHQAGASSHPKGRHVVSGMEILANMTVHQHTIAATDWIDYQGEFFWRSRPMVMHKVANPLHLHYLHWRLQFCAVPKPDLLTPEGVAIAKLHIPSTRTIFQRGPSMKEMARQSASARLKHGRAEIVSGEDGEGA